MKQKKLFTALLCAVSSIVHAASDSLDEVVVTASRTEQAADESIASVTVITRQISNGCKRDPSLMCYAAWPV